MQFRYVPELYNYTILVHVFFQNCYYNSGKYQNCPWIIFLLLAEWRRKLSTLPLYYSFLPELLDALQQSMWPMAPFSRQVKNSRTILVRPGSIAWINNSGTLIYTRIVLTILVRSRTVCREQFWYVLVLQNYLNNSGTYQNWGRKVQHGSQGTTLTFTATCPVGQVRFNFHLPYSNFHLPLKNCIQ